MRLTKYGHSCLLVEEGPATAAGPGTLSGGFEELEGLTAVLVTPARRPPRPPAASHALDRNPGPGCSATRAAPSRSPRPARRSRSSTTGRSWTSAGSRCVQQARPRGHPPRHPGGPQRRLPGGRAAVPSGRRIHPAGPAGRGAGGPGRGAVAEGVGADRLPAPGAPKVAVPVHELVLSQAGKAIHYRQLEQLGGATLRVLDDGAPVGWCRCRTASPHRGDRRRPGTRPADGQPRLPARAGPPAGRGPLAVEAVDLLRAGLEGRAARPDAAGSLDGAVLPGRGDRAGGGTARARTAAAPTSSPSPRRGVARTGWRSGHAPPRSTRLHAERVDPRSRRQVTRPAVAGELPDGVMVRAGGRPGCWPAAPCCRGRSPATGLIPLPPAMPVELLTPSATVAAVAGGYRPRCCTTTARGSAPRNPRT